MLPLLGKDQGIVNGIDTSNFAPEAKITREQLVTMLGRYAESQNITLDKTVEAKTFTDSNKIGSFAKSMSLSCSRPESLAVVIPVNLILRAMHGAAKPQKNVLHFSWEWLIDRENANHGVKKIP